VPVASEKKKPVGNQSELADQIEKQEKKKIYDEGDKKKGKREKTEPLTDEPAQKKRMKVE
jgi:hypothetical protein